MFRVDTITYIVTIIALFFSCCLIAVSETVSEDEPEAESSVTSAASVLKDQPSTADAKSAVKDKLPKPEAKSLFSMIKNRYPRLAKLDEWTESTDEDERTLDFSVTGDKITRNINFSATLPINLYEGYLRGQSVLIRHDGENISQSYMFQLESDIPYVLFNCITPRGHFEIESDPTINTDPHLHISLYDDFTLWSRWKGLKGGAGFWGEVVSKCGNPTDLGCAGELDKFSDYRGGFRFHVDLNAKHKCANFDMEIEYLQHVRFDKFECSIRTSPELKIEIFEDISLVIIGEIDFYYIDTGSLIIEPLVDVFKPFNTNWTHLWSFNF